MIKTFLVLVILLAACANYKTPGVNQSPQAMSADTLCFNYVSSKSAALATEIEARNLDCAGLLREDPLYRGPDDAAYQLTH